MIVLIDSDVLLDVGLEREPWVEDASRLFDLAQSAVLTGFVSWHSVANVHYIAKRAGAPDTRSFIGDFLDFMLIASVGHADMLFALEQDMSDFEDAMQVAAAIACRATRIVTRNTRDFAGSMVPAVTPAELLKEIGEG
jgi:predicted nucleic acid-binding protein